MFKFQCRFEQPSFSLSAYQDALRDRLFEELTKGAFEWLNAALAELPVWSGASRATFLKLARDVGYSLSVNNVSNAPDRTGLGARRSAGLFETSEAREGKANFLYRTDLAHLISMGGWIHALQVSSSAVETQFSPERAKHVMREDIADYYSAVVSGLNPRISERPTYLEMRDLFAGLRTEMTLGEEETVTQSKVAEISKQAAKLADLALKREEAP